MAELLSGSKTPTPYAAPRGLSTRPRVEEAGGAGGRPSRTHIFCGASPKRKPRVSWPERDDGTRPSKECGPGRAPPGPAGLRPAQPKCGSGGAEDATLALADRHPLRVEVFHERDGVLAADAEQVLDVRGPDFLLLLEVGDDLVADVLERGGVEEERFLDAHEPAVGDQELEQLVLLVALDA